MNYDEMCSFARVLIVEGKNDKKRVEAVLAEEIKIMCTNGTISFSVFEQWVENLEDVELYILFDRDFSGDKLRKQFIQAFSDVTVLYVDTAYSYVESTPHSHVAEVLQKAGFQVKPEFLLPDIEL
ncbi:MAG: toprim domain-containing protein [Bacilli bacterium]